MSVLADLDALKQELDKHRPLPDEKMAVVADKLRIDWTYNSNAIEGNTLTLSETSFFLREGLTVQGKPFHDLVEARNHHEAIYFVEDCLGREISEALIKEIHGLLLRGIDSIVIGSGITAVRKRIHPGQYKSDNNHVLLPDGSLHQYVDYLQVPGEMERLVQWYSNQRQVLHPVELAAGLHHRLVAIHPFADGNGRVARLLMNLVLLQHQYPVAIIRQEDRQEYYEALRLADVEDCSPFVVLVADAVARTIRLMLDVVEGRAGLVPEDVSRKIERLGTPGQPLITTEVAERARNDVARISSFVSGLIAQIQNPARPRRFEVLPRPHEHSIVASQQFAAFCRRHGLKALGLPQEPAPHPGLYLRFADVPWPEWELWFEVAATTTDVLIFRGRNENRAVDADPAACPWLRTPVLSPDYAAIQEFVLREISTFVERAATALVAADQEEGPSGGSQNLP